MTHTTETDTTTASNWSWLKSISHELYELASTPLAPTSCPFPWQELTEEVKRCFGFKEFTIAPQELILREQRDRLAGLSGPLRVIHITAPDIEGEVIIIFTTNDFNTIMSHTLGIDSSAIMTLPQEFTDAFFQFVSAETLFLVNQIGFDKSSFTLGSDTGIPEEPELCQDIHITLNNSHITARILITQTFQKAWQEHISKVYSSKPSSEQLQEVPVTLHVEAGRAHLSLEEWMKAALGDFIVIDKSFYDPTADEPSCMLTVNGKPLFKASLKDSSLKILEIPTHHEVYDPMIEKRKMNDTNHPASSPQDASFTEDESDTAHDEDSIDDEEDPFNDEDDDEDDDDLEDDDELQSTEGNETLVATPKQKSAPQKSAPQKLAPHRSYKTTTAANTETSTEGPLTLADIPVILTVELAEITLSAEKLLELQPGNVLNLDTTGSTALLTINNKIVGKGEIMKIGDTLGIRILEIGPTQ